MSELLQEVFWLAVFVALSTTLAMILISMLLSFGLVPLRWIIHLRDALTQYIQSKESP